MASVADGYWNSAVNDIDDAFFGTTVTILRGEYEQSDVVAIVEIMDNDTQDQEAGLRTVIQSRDYIIHKSAYKINDLVVEPSRGDEIQEVLDGVTRTFAVTPVGTRTGGLPTHEDEDADGVRWRVRTKEIKTGA